MCGYVLGANIKYILLNLFQLLYFCAMYKIFISFNFPIVRCSYKKSNRVLYIEVVFCHLDKFTYSSSFFVDSLGFFTSTITSPANRKFCLFLSTLYTCYFFFLACCNSWDLQKNGEQRRENHIPLLTPKGRHPVFRQET